MKQVSGQEYTESIRKIFNSDYCGIECFVSKVLEPIFGTSLELYSAHSPIKYKKDVVKNVVCVGEVNGVYANPIYIYDVTLTDSCNIGRSRVYIQEAVRSDLLPFANAFMVFHYETTKGRSWRFSFAEKDSTKSAMKTAKRYTYLAGKDYSCRTISDRFGTLYANREELKQENFIQAFSVETLSKEFFDEYKSFYNDFVNYVTNEKTLFAKFLKNAKKDEALAEKLVRDYIKKLMGRLVFIQFLQKKGWLCNDLNYLQTLFVKTNDKDKKNFLDNVLEPLFFGIFNTDKKDRKKLFEDNKWNVNLLKEWKDFPYLNGGLFEADELDELKLPIPSYFFSNPEQKDTVRKPDDEYYEDACGLFDFFERYNFTIDENDPDDAEVGVDPEMLGKIFENLLEDNKDKGAFYTPKEIVQYMCRESLIAYLTEQCSKEIDEQSIRDFVCNQIKPKKGTNSLLKALQDVKICDPAIGSGAFPMGLVNELFRCRKVLGDKAHSADIKRHIIQENIYGVDIEKGAVDIARLRFWLSLIVESDEPQTLPNLDFKIMQGNSLLECYNGIDLSLCTHTREEADFNDKNAKTGDLFFDNTLPQKLRALIDEYYNCDNHEEKRKKKESIIDNVKQQVPSLPVSIDLTANSEFFLWHTWFSDVFNRPSNRNGFDIVIGNPPYIDSEKMTEVMPEKRSLYASLYTYAKGNWDIYIAFFELSLTLGDIVAFITPDKWLSKPFGKILREDAMRKRMSIITRAGSKVFENVTVDAIVSLFEKQSKTLKAYQFISPTNVCLTGEQSIRNLKPDYYIDFMFSPYANIIKKIDENKDCLSNYALCEGACAVSDAYNLSELIENHKTESKKYYKLINTGTITKYSDLWGSKDITYLGKHIMCPVVERTKFDNSFGKTYVNRVKSPKLIFKSLNLLDVCIDLFGDVIPGKSTLVICCNDIELLKFLMGLLNSKPIYFFLKTKYASSSYCGGLSVTKDMINDLPIPQISNADRRSIVEIVDKIMDIKSKDKQADVSSLHNSINKKIYKLYNIESFYEDIEKYR